MFKIMLLSVFFVLSLNTPSYAYLDPGTGSMILQALAAVFFSTMFFAKQIWRSVLSFYEKTIKKNVNDDTK